MNHFQILVFLGFLSLSFISGLGVFAFLGTKDDLMKHRSLYLGEILLLGSALIVGELITLSLTKLYVGPIIWIVAGSNLFFLLQSQTRDYLKDFVSQDFKLDPALGLFIFGLGVLIFRNCFPLVDNDSHSAYLWMQKLWVLNQTSLFGDIGTDMRAFPPHLESVPYSLGIVLFGSETLYYGLINLYWRVIALLLVFGYTTYKFNRYFGLAAAFLVMFNDHFFYSGINKPVLLNGAVIAFIFAGVYNFWESREQNSSFRLLLSLIFLSQIVATKFPMVVFVVFFLGLMMVSQKNLTQQVKDIIKNKNWFIPLLLAIYFACFWFIKNYIITGLPTYPALAGKFEAMGWTQESSRAYSGALGGISIPMFFKYMNYLFIWPGVNALKIIAITISGLPIILFLAGLRRNLNEKPLFELSFWLGTSFLIMLGTMIVLHQDPRYYRYGLGVFSFSAVYAIWFIMHQSLSIKNMNLIALVAILISLTPYKLVMVEGGPYHYPTFQQNMDVLLNKLHTADVIDTYFNRQRAAREGYDANLDKIETSAWEVRDPVVTSAFLLPERPHVGLWFTAVVQWDSYDSEELIARNLRNYGIKWVMDPQGEGPLKFLTPEEYAKMAVEFEQYPETIYYNYGFPPELSATKY